MARSEGLNIIFLNMEGKYHLDTIYAFLEEFHPDMFLFQEAFKIDYENLKRTFGWNGVFAPMCERAFKYGEAGDLHVWGTGILTPHPITETGAVYYGEKSDKLPIFHSVEDQHHPWYVLTHCKINKDGIEYTGANTHFTLSAGGLPSDRQRRDLKELLVLMRAIEPAFYTGDFNFPAPGIIHNGKEEFYNPGELFQIVTRRYKSWVPDDQPQTIDLKYHRAKRLLIKVDHLFTSPGYRAEDVEVVFGLSDHAGIMARVIKTTPGNHEASLPSLGV